MNENDINHTPLFTVVLSGYQTEPYLQKALDSIANQTFRDFEVICYVEECTDRSLEMCQVMAERDPRFKAATGPKSCAVATTRNYGINHASGKYLVAIDGDDWFTPDMLEKLADKLGQTGEVDVLTFAAVSTETENVNPASARKFSNFTGEDETRIFSGLDAVRRSGRKALHVDLVGRTRVGRGDHPPIRPASRRGRQIQDFRLCAHEGAVRGL
jgi:glycosyltransferase involved in cell wall biosynthesis